MQEIDSSSVPLDALDQAVGVRQQSPWLVRTVVAIVLLLNVLVLAIGFFTLQQSRQHHRERVVLHATNISELLEQNIAS